MTLNEIKKELYRQKPTAHLLYVRGGYIYYQSKLEINKEDEKELKTVFFNVPIGDIGDADFTPTMDAKLLNRWLIQK